MVFIFFSSCPVCYFILLLFRFYFVYVEFLFVRSRFFYASFEQIIHSGIFHARISFDNSILIDPMRKMCLHVIIYCCVK